MDRCRVTIAALGVACIALGGCASLPWATASTEDRSGTFCDTARPLYLSRAALAAMNQSDWAQLVAHNEFGEKHCGWKPTKP
jgi:hypothetical protein